MNFTKAHAYGNDFLYVREESVAGMDGDHLTRLARAMCDRHAGVGADGLMIHAPASDGASMRLFNADGSPSEVSGTASAAWPPSCCETTSNPIARSSSIHRRGRSV